MTSQLYVEDMKAKKPPTNPKSLATFSHILYQDYKSFMVVDLCPYSLKCMGDDKCMWFDKCVSKVMPFGICDE